MKAILAFLQLIVFCSLSYGLVIRGIVTDSISGSPIDSAIIRYQIEEILDSSPTAQSDINGLFRIDVTLTENYYPYIVIQKNGYNPKGIQYAVNSDSIDLGIITINKHIETGITFSGTIIDSMTQQSLKGVRITMKKDIGDYTPYKFFTTDSAGSFNQVLTLSNSTPLLTTISHPGYYPIYLTISMTTNTVNQIIRMQPEGSLRINVSGRVLDTSSSMPVGNAKIIIFTTYFGIPDTSYTDNDGRFIRSVEAGKGSASIPKLFCTIYSNRYTTKTATTVLSFESPYSDVDLGEIFILKNDSLPPNGLQPAIIKVPFKYQEKRSLLTLNGRLVFRDNNTRKLHGASSQILLRMNKNASEKKLHITGMEN